MLIAAESVARFASLLADKSRVSICLALLDGRAWTAGELARHTGISPSTASEHLSKLVEAGLLSEERQGRHRYVRLAAPEAAQAVEDLAALAGSPAAPRSSLRAVRAHSELAAARTCYDHLAGRLATEIFDAMTAKGLLSERDGLALTAEGRAWFTELGWVPAPGASGRRPLVRACLDWTERRPHLAGAAGAALHDHLLARSWITKGRRHRAVTVTPDGHRALTGLLGIDTEGLGG